MTSANSHAWFDTEWYLNHYGDARISHLSPLNHYLEVGENLGWRPCLEFDPIWYRKHYPDVVSHNLSPLLHFVSHGINEGRYPCELIAPTLDNELWARKDRIDNSLACLQGLVACDSAIESSYACFSLARWYAWRGDWNKAADYLSGRASGKRLLPSHNGPELLLIEALGRSGQLSEAWRTLAKLQRNVPGWPDIILAATNLLAWQTLKAAYCELLSHEIFYNKIRLSWLNSLWGGNSLGGVELSDATAPLSLDNLASGSPLTLNTDKPLLTVVMPAFNASDTISTALSSLMQQREVNLDVIVVDDASTDNTVDIVEEFLRSDSRIRLLRQPSNLGAYAARNLGLREARGDLITVHDSDDWSHPDKLACQVDALQEHPEWQACCTHWVRCSRDLIFSRWRMEEGWVHRNVSSLMFRRRVFEQLGYWDHVRAEADTEYYYRIQAAFGTNAIGEVLRGVPLTFGRSVSNSLTSMGATHLVTQFGGVRADYRSASQAWHRENAGHPLQLYLPYEPGERRFPAPQELLP